MNPVVRRIVTALTTAALVVAAVIYAPLWLIRPVCGVLFVMAALEAYQLVARRHAPLSPAGLKFLVPALLLLALCFSILPLIAARHGNMMLLYVIAIIKISDMGGFALGMSSARLMKGGNHKLCPTISPNKSWEGLLGSVFASVILSLLFMPLTGLGCGKAAICGVIAALVGTFGDLVESKFKRWAGVKDSATFMPAGLGGFLDMFDSILFAPAVLLGFL